MEKLFQGKTPEASQDRLFFGEEVDYLLDVEKLSAIFWRYLDERVFPDFPEKTEDKKFEARFHKEDVKRIEIAYNLAKDIHAGHFRDEAPGVPYFVHPLNVALQVAKWGGSAAQIIAALLHDVREDDIEVRKLSNQKIEEVFQDTGVENITRKLSKYRHKDDVVFRMRSNETTEKFWERIRRTARYKLRKTAARKPVGEYIKLPDAEYYSKIATSNSAVLIKVLDRIDNLRSFGRMLSDTPLKTPTETEKLLLRVKKNINTTREFLLPIAETKYLLLAQKLEETFIRLEARLGVAETFIAKSSAQSSEFPVSTPLDA